MWYDTSRYRSSAPYSRGPTHLSPSRTFVKQDMQAFQLHRKSSPVLRRPNAQYLLRQRLILKSISLRQRSSKHRIARAINDTRRCLCWITSACLKKTLAIQQRPRRVAFTCFFMLKSIKKASESLPRAVSVPGEYPCRKEKKHPPLGSSPRLRCQNLTLHPWLRARAF